MRGSYQVTEPIFWRFRAFRNWVKKPLLSGFWVLLEQLDPLTEEQVHIRLSWTADERTRRAIERQAKLMGFDTPTEHKYVTSDHRVAGSSHAGCRSSSRADLKAIYTFKFYLKKAITC
jgi:hypothetical protein